MSTLAAPRAVSLLGSRPRARGPLRRARGDRDRASFRPTTILTSVPSLSPITQLLVFPISGGSPRILHD